MKIPIDWSRVFPPAQQRQLDVFLRVVAAWAEKREREFRKMIIAGGGGL